MTGFAGENRDFRAPPESRMYLAQTSSSPLVFLLHWPRTTMPREAARRKQTWLNKRKRAGSPPPPRTRARCPTPTWRKSRAAPREIPTPKTTGPSTPGLLLSGGGPAAVLGPPDRGRPSGLGRPPRRGGKAAVRRRPARLRAAPESSMYLARTSACRMIFALDWRRWDDAARGGRHG